MYTNTHISSDIIIDTNDFHFSCYLCRLLGKCSGERKMRLKSGFPVESMRELWTGTYTHKNVQWLSSHLLYSQANYIIQSLYLFTYFSVLETESSAWHLLGKGSPGNCLPRLQRLFKRAILFSTCTSNTFSLYLWLSLSLPRLFLCLCLCLSVSVYVSASVSAKKL